MITILTLLASQPALAQDCEIDGFARVIGRPTAEEQVQSIDLSPIESVGERVPIGFKRYFAALDADGGLISEECDCIWDVAAQNADTSSVSALGDVGGVGTSAEGRVIEFTPPNDLLECLDEEVILVVNCDGDPSEENWDNLRLTVTPSDSEGNAADSSWERCSVSGGGCQSPQKVGDPSQSAVWLLFPLIGLGGWARRRD